MNHSTKPRGLDAFASILLNIATVAETPNSFGRGLEALMA
jgi:hypothetical protein